MKYIIYYDSAYQNLVEYEIGKFDVLGDGVGLLNQNEKEIIQDNNLLFQKVISLFNIRKKRLDIVDYLNASIFVRFFHKIDCECVQMNFDVLNKLFIKLDRKLKVAVRTVYGINAIDKNLTQEIASYIEGMGFKLDVKSPDIVLSIYVGDKIYYGLDSQKNLQSNYRAGAPHYSKGDEISRAEFKLLEALERYRIDLSSIHHTIDMGASPGGWTHALAKCGIEVSAVDPAELDAKVLEMPNVKHYKMSSQEFIKLPMPKFDMIINDMKMFGDKSAHIVCNCGNLLQKNAVLIMTIKLAEKNIYEQILRALTVLNTQFDIMSVKKLFHNRQEVTVYAKYRY